MSHLKEVVHFDGGILSIPGHAKFNCEGYLPLVPNKNEHNVGVLSADEIQTLTKNVGDWLLQVNLCENPQLAYMIAKEDFLNFSIEVFPDMTSHGFAVMKTYISFMGFLYLNDDILEEHFLPVSKVKSGNINPLEDLAEAFEDIWYGKKEASEIPGGVYNIPKRQIVLQAFQSLAEETRHLIPDMETCPYFINCFVSYVKHISWYNDQENEFFVSESSYRHCRKYTGFSQGIWEMSALFGNTRISPTIRQHRYFDRLSDAVSEASTLTNDVVSLKKEIRRDERDNLVLIKVIQGSSPADAVRDTLRIIFDQTIEAMRHGRLLTDAFPTDTELSRYLNYAWNWMNANATAPTYMRRYEYIFTEKARLPQFHDTDQSEFIFRSLLRNPQNGKGNGASDLFRLSSKSINPA